MRAERLAALGAAELVRENELSPQRLAAAIERAASREPATVSIDSGGAAHSARLIAAMMGPGERPAECPVERPEEDFAAASGQRIIAQ
jgi:predicted glycosyltransferase